MLYVYIIVIYTRHCITLAKKHNIIIYYTANAYIIMLYKYKSVNIIHLYRIGVNARRFLVIPIHIGSCGKTSVTCARVYSVFQRIAACVVTDYRRVCAHFFQGSYRTSSKDSRKSERFPTVRQVKYTTLSLAPSLVTRRKTVKTALSADHRALSTAENKSLDDDGPGSALSVVGEQYKRTGPVIVVVDGVDIRELSLKYLKFFFFFTKDRSRIARSGMVKVFLTIIFSQFTIVGIYRPKSLRTDY